MKFKDIKLLLATALAVLIISAVCVEFYPTMQDFMASNSRWNGLSNFCKDYGACPLDSFEHLPEKPQGKALLSLPYLSYNEEELAELKGFVSQGGRLILMDDYGQGNRVLEYLGLKANFSGQMLLDPLFCYKKPKLPRITNFSPEVSRAGVKAIVLNHATALTGVDSETVLARSSKRSFLDVNGDGKRSQAEPKGPLPIAARFELGQGEVILVSDPSILINSMMGKDDNRAFLDYLTYNIKPGDILVDRVHLEKSTLDKSKLKLEAARELFSKPLPALGLVALVFAGVSGYLFWKERGGLIDRNGKSGRA